MNFSLFVSMFVTIFVIIQQRKKKRMFIVLLRRKCMERLQVDISLLKNLMGREVRIYYLTIDSMSSSETGLIKSVNEDWVLLENKKGKDVLISNDKIIKINTK
ncbi:MAG TPA: hypothetical protein ENG70_04060 [Candidatus Cloacimonetes bacterium]|nr:hypothetical protein [Candidatus Cloacimonadota bacterium]HEX38017.1 hypothetical protein [Candidatus Cloacimonadota bacterium]